MIEIMREYNEKIFEIFIDNFFKRFPRINLDDSRNHIFLLLFIICNNKYMLFDKANYSLLYA